MTALGWLLDNRTGARRAARVEAHGGHFVIHADGLAPQMIDPMLLRHVEMRRGTEVYALKGIDGWRLGLKAIDDPLIEARLPEIAKAAEARDLTLWIAAAAVACAFAVVSLPFF